MDITDVQRLLESSPEGCFLELNRFNGTGFGACSITGVSAGWEMHPYTDEFFYVIHGTVEITLLEASGPQHYVAPAGRSFVVPKGLWHRPGAPLGARFIFYTPGQSLYPEAKDPRTTDHARA